MPDRNRQLDQAEQDFANAVAAALTETADEFAYAVQAATELVAARFSVGRIARMWNQRVTGLVRRLLGTAERAATAAAEDVGGQLPDGWDDLPGRYDDDTLPAGLGQYVETTEHLLRAVGDRLAEAARVELAAGVDAGEGIDQLRARLQAAFTREGAHLGPVREQRIAQTEATRAWNTSTLAAAEAATGVDRPVVKQWITRHDAKVRTAHDQVDGQIRMLGEPFVVAGVEMQAPGDPSAPPSLVIHCRCRLGVAPELRTSAYRSKDGPRSGAFEPKKSFVWSGLSVPPPATAVRQWPALTGPINQWHGTLGRPSYRKYHPGGSNRTGRVRHPKGGMLGSRRYKEEEHSAVMEDYTASGYVDMNEWLRRRASPEDVTVDQVKRQVSVLNDLIEIQEPTTTETTLFRGTRQTDFNLNPGDVFHDRAFVSTSSGERIGRKKGRKGGTLFRITAPPGTQMLDVAAVGGDDYEDEFILPPGSQFRVAGVERPDDPQGPGVIYDLEVINV